MSTSPPGTVDSAFFAFVVIDELVRTLVDRDVLPREDAVGAFTRTIETLNSMGSDQARRCIPIAEEMIREYSEPTDSVEVP